MCFLEAYAKVYASKLVRRKRHLQKNIDWWGLLVQFPVEEMSKKGRLDVEDI